MLFYYKIFFSYIHLPRIYFCCINRIYFYIRYRYKYSTKIISLFSRQCNSFFLFFQLCSFLLNFIILHFFVYREFKKNNILAHSLNIFNFSKKKITSQLGLLNIKIVFFGIKTHELDFHQSLGARSHL